MNYLIDTQILIWYQLNSGGFRFICLIGKSHATRKDYCRNQADSRRKTG
jgi:hypothetical protein